MSGGSRDVARLVQTIMADARRGMLELPTLPDVALRVRVAMQDNGRRMAELARIIQVDPALTARLVKVVNSPLYRANRHIDDCHKAITRLGLVTTRNLVMGFTLRNLFQPRQHRLAERLRESWRHSCRVAAISSVLARLTPGVDTGRALLAGLIHDIGELPILLYLEKRGSVEGIPLERILRQLRAPLGSLVLQAWQFDRELVEVPRRVEEWGEAAEGPIGCLDIVQVAHVHSLFGTGGVSRPPPLYELPAFRRLPISRLGPDASLELLEQSQQEIDEVLDILHGGGID
ncbi:MAG TPA: HDOD domain-containing protein [Thiotrichales bacterium]|nr:HDOD domain-containing protein [Thiotrichales bacterium]